ncbi:MAG: hypothetical protein IJS59_02975 [Bacteroidaceae bacterium]|nr:hypothetical protein [Bacteroidaceae bacterium]
MKTNKYLLLPALFLIATFVKAQVETKHYVQGQNTELIKRVQSFTEFSVTKQLPSISNSNSYADIFIDKDMDIPYKFGYAFDVDYTLDDGSWKDVDGGRVWTIKIVSKGALSLNFILDNFSLPQGGKLEIINKDCDVLYGPVFHDAIPCSGRFMTDIIKGDESIFFLYEPLECEGQSTLSIKRIVHGYKDSDINESSSYGVSSPCNIDIACYPMYDNESKSIGKVLLSDGMSLCSGSLLMTTDMSFKPYFLTAFHCIDGLDNDDFAGDGVISSIEKDAVQSWLFKFNYKKTSCGGNSIATTYSYNGAILKAAWLNTDFALVEITSTLSSNPNLTWLGWDKSGNVPTNGIGIHHPKGDVMKISVELDTFQLCKWEGDFGTNEYNHWLVDFDYGVTESSSSGSPLLNQNNNVVGQLHGGVHYENPCLQTLRKYGKFNESWSGGGTDDTCLSSWLDPIGTEQSIMVGGSPMTISGPDIPCGYSFYFVENIPAGYDVVWSWKRTCDVVLTPDLVDPNTCVLNNLYHNYINNTLVATIYRNGQLIRTLEKRINTGANFYGTIQQAAGLVGNYYYPGMSATSFNCGDILFVLCGTMITLTSPDFSAATITHAGNAKNWTHSGNTITFNFSYLSPIFANDLNSLSSNHGMETITGTYSGSCETFQFTVRGTSPPTPVLANSPKTLHVTSDRNSFIFSICETGNDIEKDNDSTLYILYRPLPSWQLTVFNSLTGMVIFDGKVYENSISVDSTGWKDGI